VLALVRSDRVVVRIRESLGRIDPRIEWPHGLVRFGVASCVAVVAALGAAYFVKAIELLDGEARSNAAANYDDRAFGGGIALGVDQEALEEARGWIPKDGTYRLVVDASATNIGQFARYYLMPRRPKPDARWVLCYRCDLSRFDDRLDVVYKDDAGVTLGRLHP
jgi:hypothetical protein